MAISREANTAACAKWRAANRDKSRAVEHARVLRDPLRQVRQYAQNPEPRIASTRRYNQANPDKRAANRARYRASRLQATPQWADEELIGDIYKYAQVMRAHGVDCHVDHEVPLMHDLVSGLHAHTNLTVLLARDNLVKRNRFAIG